MLRHQVGNSGSRFRQAGGNFACSVQFCPNVDPWGVDLLRRMLTYDPNARITARQAVEHPFFRVCRCLYDSRRGTSKICYDAKRIRLGVPTLNAAGYRIRMTMAGTAAILQPRNAKRGWPTASDRRGLELQYGPLDGHQSGGRRCRAASRIFQP